MTGLSPTQNSLKKLRNAGFTAVVAEKWIAQVKRRVDLFGFGDIAAVHPNGRFLLCQATTAGNMASRMTKLAAIDAAQYCIRAGVEIEVHGWKKDSGLWVCRTARWDGSKWEIAWE